MTAKPNEVLTAMILAMADAELEPNSTYESLLKAALRAARELGCELKPRESTSIMDDAGEKARLEGARCYDVWAAMYDKSPNILAEGE